MTPGFNNMNGLDTTTLRRASDIAWAGMVFFGSVGIFFLYLYIFLLEIALTDKVLFLGVLTITIAFIFLGLYSTMQDSLRAAERVRRRKGHE
jgi:hypothetical protein